MLTHFLIPWVLMRKLISFELFFHVQEGVIFLLLLSRFFFLRGVFDFLKYIRSFGVNFFGFILFLVCSPSHMQILVKHFFKHCFSPMFFFLSFQDCDTGIFNLLLPFHRSLRFYSLFFPSLFSLPFRWGNFHCFIFHFTDFFSSLLSITLFNSSTELLALVIVLFSSKIFIWSLYIFFFFFK